MSRRSGSESRRRTGLVGVRLNDEEHELVRRVAEDTGLSLGGVMREAYLSSGTPHDHREYVEGCFRCDLSRAEGW